ncbi:MAG TPA: hypothetical protein VMM82_15410, partial [Spirochaetia bacterium]|nr:hypothetical protein [Spirochaetia bacterium]
MKARYLAVIFVAAVLVPSVLLSVLSIRSAGREEAYVEKQLATTLLAEVTHTASLVSSGVDALAQDLHSSVTPASGPGFQGTLSAWKKKNPLVGVPFLLSSNYGILWPRLSSSSTESERSFLQENSDFLSGKSATAVFANIAVVHKEEVLSEARKLDSSVKKSAAPQPVGGTLRDRSIKIPVRAEAQNPPAPSSPAAGFASAAPSASASSAAPAASAASEVSAAPATPAASPGLGDL